MSATHITTDHHRKFREIKFAVTALRDECRARFTSAEFESVPAECLMYEVWTIRLAAHFGLSKLAVTHLISGAAGSIGELAHTADDAQIETIAHTVMALLSKEARRVVAA